MKLDGKNPKVSIVIPVYNGSNYLKEAIDSALAQTYKNIEIIVVNDGSKDKGATERIAKSYGNKVKYYRKENGGVATALNLGIEKMTGDYFSWLSHDDMYEKTKIEDQVKLLNKLEKREVIVASQAKTLFVSGIKKKATINADTFKFIDIFLATSAMVGINGCSLLIPKNAFEECGLFDPNLPVTQDYDLWFRMKDNYKFILLGKYLVISRRHAEQDSVQKQDILFEAGDQLHRKFLNSIPYSRFEEYFNHNKKNISHSYENYKIYKSRGYNKTCSALLKNILKYYYKNNKNLFYSIFASEIELAGDSKSIDLQDYKKITKVDQNIIDIAYRKLLTSGVDRIPLKKPSLRQKTNKSKTTRIINSLRQDGLYLSGEKAIRKIYSKIKK